MSRELASNVDDEHRNHELWLAGGEEGHIHSRFE